jgi:hypothetical protein
MYILHVPVEFAYKHEINARTGRPFFGKFSRNCEKRARVKLEEVTVTFAKIKKVFPKMKTIRVFFIRIKHYRTSSAKHVITL